VRKVTVEVTLAEFLLARITEDEAAARAAATREAAEQWEWIDPEGDAPCTEADVYQGVITGSLRSVAKFKSPATGWDLPVFVTSADGSPEIRWHAAGHIARWDPARVLRECVAKRRIVERCIRLSKSPHARDQEVAQDFLTDLASAYADHPDYRDQAG
jgi:hypothetical protein